MYKRIILIPEWFCKIADDFTKYSHNIYYTMKNIVHSIIFLITFENVKKLLIDK